MSQLKVVWFYLGVMYLAVFTYSTEMPPDLGPSGPTFETCETYQCPENSTCVEHDNSISCSCSSGKSGVNCEVDDPCLERKTDCPEGSLCFGDCRPNIICEGATGHARCRGCTSGWTGMHCDQQVNKCKGTSCDVGEIKTAESKNGKGSQLVCSITLLFLTFFMHAFLAV